MSIVAVVALAGIILSIRFRSSYKTTVFLGAEDAGKSSIIRHMAKSGPTRQGKIHVSSEGKSRFLEPVSMHPRQAAKMLRRHESTVYVFDVSPHGPPIERQLKDYRSYKDLFGSSFIHAANKTDIADKKKLHALRKNIPDIHEVSGHTGAGIDALKSSIESL